MYSTCLFCTAHLGANESVEHFPVGRRLAFDSDKGRLWVVCGNCARWNLSPLEERWEAIEECERLFRATRLRMSTDQIGMARLKEGLELVRIGSPMRPEMAAWRYGDQFGRRRRRMTQYGVASTLAVGGLYALGGLGATAFAPWLYIAALGITRGYLGIDTSPLALSGTAAGRIVIAREHLKKAKLGWQNEGERWSLVLPHRGVRNAGQPFWDPRRRHETVFDGDDAIWAARMILPTVNHAGAGRRVVAEAVSFLEETPSPEGLMRRTARSFAGKKSGTLKEQFVPIAGLPSAVRLALEMSTHEESERAALEGELRGLEQAWRSAEEIAQIADNLIVDPGVSTAFDALRSRRDDGPRGLR